MKTFEELYEENQKMVDGLAKYYKGKYTNYEYDEIQQTAMIGYWKAYEKYDENRGAKFTTYAYMVIEGHIKNWIRKQMKGRRKECVQRNELFEVKSKKDLSEEVINKKYGLSPEQLSLFNVSSLDNSVEEKFGYTQREFEEFEVQLDIKSSGLSKKEIVLLNLQMEGYTVREISKKVGVHYSTISRNLKKISKRLVELKKPRFVSEVDLEQTQLI